MTNPNIGGSTWGATGPAVEPAAQPEAWQATRAQTQLARDEEDYLDSEQKDIGRPVGDNLRELFVSCDAGPAMQQQLEHLRPEFIAIHDVATHSSRKLLAGIAAASKGAVQKLVIRRQGYGTPLATLEFVELPTAQGHPLRIYSTEADADTTSRHALARTLLAFSALGVILVGDVPGHSIAGTFKPLHDDMIAGPWPNRNLLLLPLSTANALVTQGMELARGTGVNVRTTPQVARPADAWNFISSTWGRLRAELGSTPRPMPGSTPAGTNHPPAEIAQRPAAPLPLRPMPALPGKSARDQAARDPLSRYVHQLSELTGMVSCCVFEVASGRDLVHAGASPGPVDLAEHGAELLSAMLTVSRTLGLGHALPEAAITLGAHHLVLRAVPKHPGLALHAVLDKTHANLTLARLQIMRMDALFDEPGMA
ncbi:hypothetical protein [Piscinibacter sp.]|uniref:hypothetical protein n=1 Tax=Piscinibacter sp. TaxID=1903157 RepID=UPI002BBCCAAB|nr:hypothetical protein [Albitalea sp.]HUG23670.1 hypothetical protein [Albitalea sp.]